MEKFRKEEAEQLIDPIVPGQDFYLRVLFPPPFELVSQTDWFRTLKERYVTDKGDKDIEYYERQPVIQFTTHDKPYENIGIGEFQIGKKQTEPTRISSYNKLKKANKINNLLSQIEERAFKPITNEIWNILQFDGFPEEKDIENPEMFEYIQLNIPQEDIEKLKVQDDDTINKYNEFDIKLKEEYPNHIDLIDYDKGIVRIVRVKKEKKSYNQLKKKANIESIIEKAQKEVGENVYLDKNEKNWLLANIPINVYKQDKSKAKEVVKDDGKMYLTLNSKGEGEVKRIAKEDITENKIPAQSFVQSGILPIEIGVVVTPKGYSVKPLWKADMLPKE